MTIGNAIKERRKMLKITQRTLAELAGVGINTLTKIERNEGNPSLDVLERILDTLGLELRVGIKTAINYEARDGLYERHSGRSDNRSVNNRVSVPV